MISGEPPKNLALSSRLRAELLEFTAWLKQWSGLSVPATNQIAPATALPRTTEARHRLISTTISTDQFDDPSASHGTVLHLVEYLAAPGKSSTTDVSGTSAGIATLLPPHQASVQRPVVLMLPFTSGHSRNLRPLAESLARQGIQSVAIDPPGHGRSAGERGVFRIEPLLEQLMQLTELYARERPGSPVLIAGTSWGGDLAILSALYHGCQMLANKDRAAMPTLAGVIGQAIITPWQRDVFQKFRPDIKLLFDASDESVNMVHRGIGDRIAVEQMFEADELYTSHALRHKYLRDPLALKSYDTNSYLQYLQFDLRDQFEDMPATIATPTLVLHGEQDRLVSSRYARVVVSELRRRLPCVDARFHETGGHALFEEQPDWCAQQIVHWWDSQFKPTSQASTPSTASKSASGP